MWPAVPSVSAISPRARPRGGDAGDRVLDVLVAEGAGVEQQAPLDAAQERRRAARAARPRSAPARVRHGARGALQRQRRQRAASDAGLRRRDLAADARRAAARRARGRAPAARAPSAAPASRRGAPRRVAVQAQRRLQRGEGQLVDAQRAGQRVAAAALDRLARADEEPGLRAAEQLVAAEAGQRRAGRDASRERRLAGQHRGAGRGAPEPRSSTTGRPRSRAERRRARPAARPR